jgi:GH43 family beta-xylosidase
MILHEGFYYYCESRNERTIHVRKSKSILEIGNDDGVKVWTPPVSGPNSKNVWAPELHLVNGKWYIYYAADDGSNENHRMWVLESESADPQGNYRSLGSVETGGWAIDGTLLEVDGRLHMVWSGWPGKVDGQQNLYIARMENPFTIGSPRQLLTTPDQPWERHAMPICEGPQVLKRNGHIFIVYSASASWTEEYCLGMLLTTSKDVMDAGAWKKVGPVFQKTETVWGVGHCSFIKGANTPAEDWIVYHAKSKRAKGWHDRHIHAQRFTWRLDGLPDFGMPSPVRRPVHVVATEVKPAPAPSPIIQMPTLPAAEPAAQITLAAS